MSEANLERRDALERCVDKVIICGIRDQHKNGIDAIEAALQTTIFNNDIRRGLNHVAKISANKEDKKKSNILLEFNNPEAKRKLEGKIQHFLARPSMNRTTSEHQNLFGKVSVEDYIDTTLRKEVKEKSKILYDLKKNKIQYMTYSL